MILASGILGAPAVEVTFSGRHDWSGGSTSTFTFSGVTFHGSAAVVLVFTGSGFTTSVTIDGVAATEYRLGGSGLDSSLRWYVAATSAASGDVVITRSGSTTVMRIYVWSLADYDSLTPVDWNTAYDLTPPTSLSASVEEGGAILAGSYGTSGADISGVDTDGSGSSDVGGHKLITDTDAAYAVSHSANSYLGYISFR